MLLSMAPGVCSACRLGGILLGAGMVHLLHSPGEARANVLYDGEAAMCGEIYIRLGTV